MSAFEDEIFAKWQRWVRQINEQITRLRFRRMLWRGTLELMQSAEVKDGTYAAFLTGLYVDGQAMGIRRLSTAGDDEISIGRLLLEITQHPTVISRDRIRSIPDLTGLDEHDRALRLQWADEGFASWVAPGTNVIDIQIPTSDLGQLSDQAKKVVAFANRTVAHLDPRGWDASLTFGELTRAIDTVSDLHARYLLLLTGVAKGMLTPTIQGDWREPFRQALIGRVDEDDDRLDY